MLLLIISFLINVITYNGIAYNGIAYNGMILMTLLIMVGMALPIKSQLLNLIMGHQLWQKSFITFVPVIGSIVRFLVAIL